MIGVSKILGRRDDEDTTAKVGPALKGPVAQLKEGITFEIHTPQELPIRRLYGMPMSGCIRGYRPERQYSQT